MAYARVQKAFRMNRKRFTDMVLEGDMGAGGDDIGSGGPKGILVFHFLSAFEGR